MLKETQLVLLPLFECHKNPTSRVEGRQVKSLRVFPADESSTFNPANSVSSINCDVDFKLDFPARDTLTLLHKMENLYTVDSLCEKTNSTGDKQVVDNDCELLVEEWKTKRQKKGKSKQDKGDEDDKHRNWLNTEVESLIALKGEMQLDFVKNAKKQGVDMWLKLHSKLMCLHLEFRKTPKACMSKFSDIYKAYKDDKQSNNVFGESRHTCKFYDSMDV